MFSIMLMRLNFIGQILSYTPADHPDHQNLVDALNKANETCSQVNEGVREKENSDKLEWLQTHIQCDGLPEVKFQILTVPLTALTASNYTSKLFQRRLFFSSENYIQLNNKLSWPKEISAFRRSNKGKPAPFEPLLHRFHC